MTNSAKDKGDRGEREVEALLRDLSGNPLDSYGNPRIRRELGAGRKDDRGDIAGIPYTAIQVAWRNNVTGTIKSKLIEVERQRQNRRSRFASVFLKWDRGPGWIVVMTPQMWHKMWKYAVIGYEVERERRRAVTRARPATKLQGHDPRSATPSSRKERTGADSRPSQLKRSRNGVLDNR